MFTKCINALLKQRSLTKWILRDCKNISRHHTLFQYPRWRIYTTTTWGTLHFNRVIYILARLKCNVKYFYAYVIQTIFFQRMRRLQKWRKFERGSDERSRNATLTLFKSYWMWCARNIAIFSKKKIEIPTKKYYCTSFEIFRRLRLLYHCSVRGFRSLPPLARITRYLIFSAAAQDRRLIFWQRRSKGRLVSEARRSSPTTDRRIRSPTFTVRSGRTRTIRRRITTSWRWLTSPDAAFSRETWVIRSSELRGTDFYEALPPSRWCVRSGLTTDVAQTDLGGAIYCRRLRRR